MTIPIHQRWPKFLVDRSRRALRFLKSTGGRQEGFTLVELMVSLLILSISIMGVARLFIFSNQHSLSGNKELVAASLIQEIR
ncbi:MAG: prepilin-type N-terminal cleavage/methylation domain-containing protein, partial [Candidatus Eisenbacteria bacterium]|nr:prepilin-type N-terminal cleavage/methylation domain-containing protein [Candidatus Eisenbacteria bacterium]